MEKSVKTLNITRQGYNIDNFSFLCLQSRPQMTRFESQTLFSEESSDSLFMPGPETIGKNDLP